MLYDFNKPTDNLSKMSQRFCLRWNNHQSNLLSVFDQLFHAETFTDVTLAVEGQLLKAHKMVLSACSPYFQALFLNHPEKHPIVILKDVPYSDMKSLLDFMYRGEVSVDQERLTAFLRVAESLRIKGLTEVNEEKCDLPAITNSLMQQNMAPTLTPPPQLHRIHPYLTAQRKQQSHMLMNPLLGNALTQPKRKRGRPRKLSGSSNGTPGINSSPSESFRDEYDNRAKNSFIQGSPEMMEMKMGADGFGGSGGEGSEEPTTRDDDDIETLEGDAEDTEPMASTSKENSPRKGASADDNAGNCFLTQENDQNHSNVQPTITLELIRPEPTKSSLRETRIQHQQSEKYTKTETTVELEPTSGIHFLTNEQHQEPFLVPKLEQGGYDPEYSVGSMTAADADGCAPIKNKNELLEYLTRSDGSVVCKLCGEVLASRTHWYRHKYKFHVASSQQPAPLFKCEECHVFFKSRKGYIGHLSSRHSEPEAISPDPPIMEGLLGAVKQEAVDHELAIPKSELPRPDRRVNRVLRGATSSGECAVSKGADWEQEQRDKEERLVADIIDRVRRECEAQGATVTRRGYSRRSTVMNT